MRTFKRIPWHATNKSNFFGPPTWMATSFIAPWTTRIRSISFKRSYQCGFAGFLIKSATACMVCPFKIPLFYLVNRGIVPFDSIVAVVKFSSLNKKFLKIFQQEFEFPALSMYVNVNVPYKFLFHATKYCCRPYLFGSYKFSIWTDIKFWNIFIFSLCKLA